jgi:hypothetical protein
MPIVAPVILRGLTNLAFPYIGIKSVAGQRNVSVEVLLPEGGHGLQLSQYRPRISAISNTL